MKRHRICLESLTAPPDGKHTNLEIVDIDNRYTIYTNRTLLSIDRTEFNRLLFENIREDAEIIFDRALKIDQRNKIVVTTKNFRISADYLIGADGVNSVVKKHIRNSDQKKINLIQIEFKPHLFPDSTMFVFDSNTVSDFYSYIIPKDRYLVAGTKYSGKGTVGKLKNLLKNFKLEGKINNLESYRLTIINSSRDVLFGKGNILLAGEASGFVSPSSGEGISFALESGMLAAKAIAKSYGSNENLLENYRKLSKNLIKRLESRIEKSKVIFNPEFRKEYFRRYYDGHNIERIQEEA